MPSSACAGDPLRLHSFPTRRSSDLYAAARKGSSSIRTSHCLCQKAFGTPCFSASTASQTSSATLWRWPRLRVATSMSPPSARRPSPRSEEHTSELQSRENLVCRLLLAPATPYVSTLSLHDALPISTRRLERARARFGRRIAYARKRSGRRASARRPPHKRAARRSGDGRGCGSRLRCHHHRRGGRRQDRKSTRLNSSHVKISYAVFCLRRRPPTSPLFPYTTLFRSLRGGSKGLELDSDVALPMPESVRDAVLQRVDRLTNEQRDALAMAAVAGRDFDVTTIGAEAVASLPAGGLVVDQGEGRLAFRHSLIRDALYEAIPWGRRRAMHRAVAKRLEATSAAPHAIATHWITAGDSTAGRTWLIKAARASHDVCAYRDAAAQLSGALDLWPAETDIDGRLEVLEMLARCAELGGPATLAVRALTEAIELLETSADRRRYAEAQRRLAASLEAQGAWDRAVTVRQLAAGAFAVAGEPAQAAVERLTAAARLRSAASFKAALELIAIGKGEAEAAGRKDLELRLLALEGNVMARAGGGDDGVSIVRTALADALARGDFGTAAEAYQRLADSLEHVGDFRGARAAYVEAADFCRANGAASMGDVCLACLTMVLRQGGDWDHACDLCREVLESSSSNLHAQAVAHGVPGSIMFHRGRLQQARSELHNSNVIARRIGLAAMEIDSETHLARLAAAGGRLEEARERCLRVIRRWGLTDRERHYSITNLRWIASFAVDAADTEILRAATAALTTIESQPDEEAHAGANLALAEGLMTEGDAAAAVARFEQALTILADLELPLDRAEIELRAAAAYMLTGDRQTAGARYRSAYRSAIRLGARPLANRIAEEVAKLGEKVEQRLGRLAAAGVGRGGLSPRELEVTRLVASGLSSREVATTLSLSPRTVEMHVHRILSKLDCRTRVDITRRAAELGLLRT